MANTSMNELRQAIENNDNETEIEQRAKDLFNILQQNEQLKTRIANDLNLFNSTNNFTIKMGHLRKIINLASRQSRNINFRGIARSLNTTITDNYAPSPSPSPSPDEGKVIFDSPPPSATFTPTPVPTQPTPVPTQPTFTPTTGPNPQTGPTQNITVPQQQQSYNITTPNITTPKGTPLLRPEFFSVGTNYFNQTKKDTIVNNVEWSQFNYVKSKDPNINPLEDGRLQQEKIRFGGSLFMPKYEPPIRPPNKKSIKKICNTNE